MNSANVRSKLVWFNISGVIVDLDFRDARTALESEYLRLVLLLAGVTILGLMVLKIAPHR